MSGPPRYELSAADGSPSQRIAKRAKPYAQPRVATVQRASELLGIPEGELAARVAAAGLEVFAANANGHPTYGWKQVTALVEGRQP
jgi:hypothetical protein